MSKRKSVATMSVRAVPPRGDRAGTEDTLMSSGFSDDSRQSSLAEKRHPKPNSKIELKQLSTLQSQSESDPGSDSSATSNKKGKAHGNRAHGLSLQSSDESESEPEPEIKQSNAGKGSMEKWKNGKLNGSRGPENREPPAPKSRISSAGKGGGVRGPSGVQNPKRGLKSIIDSSESEADDDYREENHKGNRSKHTAVAVVPRSSDAKGKPKLGRRRAIESSESESEDDEQVTRNKTTKGVAHRISFRSQSESEEEDESDHENKQVKKGRTSGVGSSSKSQNVPPRRGGSRSTDTVGTGLSTTRNVRQSSIESTTSSASRAEERRLKYAHIEVSPSASLFSFNFKKPSVRRRTGSRPSNSSIDTEVMDTSLAIDHEIRPLEPAKGKNQSRKSGITSLKKPVVHDSKTENSKSASASDMRNTEPTASDKRNTEPTVSDKRNTEPTPSDKINTEPTASDKKNFESTASAQSKKTKSPVKPEKVELVKQIIKNTVAKKSTSRGSLNTLGLAPERSKRGAPADKQSPLKKRLDETYDQEEASCKNKRSPSPDINPAPASSSTKVSENELNDLFSSLHANVNRKLSTQATAKGVEKPTSTSQQQKEKGDEHNSAATSTANSTEVKQSFLRSKRMTSMLDHHTPDASYDDQDVPETRTTRTRSGKMSGVVALKNQKIAGTEKKKENTQKDVLKPLELTTTPLPEEGGSLDSLDAAVAGTSAVSPAKNRDAKSEEKKKLQKEKVKPSSLKLKSPKAYKVKDPKSKLRTTPPERHSTPDIPCELSSSAEEDEGYTERNRIGASQSLVAATPSDGVDAGDENNLRDDPDIGDHNNNDQAVRVHQNFNNVPVDVSSMGSLRLACLVDNDGESYRNLTNAHQAPQVSIMLSSPCISYVYPQHLSWTQIHPGVYMCITFNSGDVKTGYMRLDPKTVKPLEKSGSAYVCMCVMDGKVHAKSTSFDFNALGEPYLNSIVLFEGSHVTVPGGTMYSIENWETEEASLQFTIVRQGNSDEGVRGEE